MVKQHKQANDSGTLDQVKDVMKTRGDMLLEEVERKARFKKQTYYDGGAKTTKIMVRLIKKQQTLRTIHKIREPEASKILYEPEEIEKIFED